MKKINLILVLFLFFIQTAIPSNNLNGVKNKAAGIWIGKLKVSGIELRIVFNIIEDKDGILTATMDSPDQGAKDIPVDSVIVNDENIKLVVNAINGYFEGSFSRDGLAISGNWHQSGRMLPLLLNKTDRIEEAKRPQEPKPPFPYKSEEVSFKNKSAGITLAGTLTMPEKGDNFPAVLLITGSGPQNRDEEIFGHKPFLVIADYLTRNGIAVLRFDDRGVGKSTGTFSGATSQDFASDASAGLEFLKTVKEINPRKIGLIGHSEGGLIAPIVAVKSADAAFIILLAGPGLPGDQILLKQEALIRKLSGASEETVLSDTTFKSKIFDVIKEDLSEEQTKNNLKSIVGQYYNGLNGKEKSEIGSEDELFSQILKAYTNPWMKYFISYNPVPVLEKVKCPVLALNGSKDLQVPPKEDLEAIKNALENGGNKNIEILELPGLNHLFQTAKTGLPSEYSAIEETFSPGALKIMSDWIHKTLKNNNED